MKQSDLLRKQADMVDMAEKYGIDDWRDLVSVDNGFGVREQLRSIDWLYSFEQSKPKFALGVVEGKPVFEGDEFYYNGGALHKHKAGIGYEEWSKETWDKCSWTPPKPKTVMVELPIGYVAWMANMDNHEFDSRVYSPEAAKAWRKALEEAYAK